MLNTNLKRSYWENWHSHSIFQVWKICPQINFWWAPTHSDVTEFSNLFLHLRNRILVATCARIFYYFNFERYYDSLKSRSSWYLLSKNVFFREKKSEIEAKSKMEYPPYTLLKIQSKNSELKVLELAKYFFQHVFYRLEISWVNMFYSILNF